MKKTKVYVIKYEDNYINRDYTHEKLNCTHNILCASFFTTITSAYNFVVNLADRFNKRITDFKIIDYEIEER